MGVKRIYEYKPIDQLVFSDDFMFGAVMSEPKICKGVIELLLQVKIDHIEYPELQKPLTPFYTKKGVRLDVYVADSNRVFDVECQSYKAENIGKRARYYQSMLDIGSLARGASYSELKESYVIFICLCDPFGAGLPVYTFNRKCRESAAVELGDETHHVIFNAAAYENETDPDIKAFLLFVKNNKVESDLTREIATVVQTKKFEQSFINEYLAWTLHDQDVEMRGRFDAYADLIKSGLLSVETAAEKLGITKGELQTKLDNMS
ncbi:MAG: Rpn family recombination-promoting nuclease/putative transposase [Treponema sp.]|nr:Rpn family recombination-promoting nuclease/putative transposase [Treponema sp.]